MKTAMLALKPTQFALGLREVSRKVAKLKQLSPDARSEYLRSHPSRQAQPL